MIIGSATLTGPPDTRERARRHERAIADAAQAYAALPTGQRVRLAKRTSNLFRTRSATTSPGLDLSALQGVVEIDVDACTVRVGGLTTCAPSRSAVP